MIKRHRLLLAASLAAIGNLVVGCATNGGAIGTPATGGAIAATSITGGATSGTVTTAASGGSPATGGFSTTTSSASGGTQNSESGAQSGGAQATGGRVTTGGTSSVTGTSLSTGGTVLASGGRSSTGGASAVTGGTPSTGSTSTAAGGTPGTGGTSTTAGGTLSTGGVGSGGTTAVDPAVNAAINACMDKLPYGGNLLSADKRAPIVTAIINACSAFAPSGADWQTYCQMFLVAAINAESSYDTEAGTKGAGTDPSVGLLQIRFSSVVRDFADYGPVSTLTRIGCNFGTVTSSDSYATKGSMMAEPACNVAIGAWYYFIFASGNGGSSVVWVPEYCSGGGVAGNLHIGIASFLMGGDAAHQSLSGADFYYNEIKGWFDPCVTYSGTHPFELTIPPERKKYCK